MIQVKQHRVDKNLNLTIALFSDLHYSKNFSFKKLRKIANKLIELQPDYICIAGDLVDQGNAFDTLDCTKLIEFIRKIATISPVIIGIGNHDIAVEKNRKVQYYNQKFEQLKQIPNVHILDNQMWKDDKVCFLGYTLSYDYYYKDKESVKPYFKDLDDKLLKYVDSNYVNILLCHSPIYILSEYTEQSKVLNQMDFVFSGHMHNGLVPPILDFIPGNFGFVSPFSHLITKYARGTCIRGKQKLRYCIISGGILKFSEVSPKFFHPFNFIYSSSIDFLHF